jgi:hypothetical protein
MHACHLIIEDGLADPDPWHGLCRVIEDLCEVHSRNRGFTTAFTAMFPYAVDLTAERERSMALLAQLTRRAREAGHLHPGFVLDDLILILLANGGLQSTSTETRVAASRRFAALAIRAFRA